VVGDDQAALYRDQVAVALHELEIELRQVRRFRLLLAPSQDDHLADGILAAQFQAAFEDMRRRRGIDRQGQRRFVNGR
jgi:hypothetical protein